MRVLIIFGIWIAIIFPVFGQNKSSKLRPQWVRSTPRSIDKSQLFIVVVDESKSLESILENRYDNLVNYLEKEVRTDGTIKSNITTESKDVKGEFITSIKGVCYKHKLITDYWERSSSGFYRHYTLYQISMNPNIPFENTELTSKYGFRGVWRSALVPGWGQLYKGSKTKGAFILGGTVALAGGIIYAENKRVSYNRNLAESYGSDRKRFYADKASTMSNVRNICIGGAIALYIYNLIDAAVSSGAKRVKVTKRGGAAPNFTLLPTATPNMTGVSLTYNF